MLFRRTRHQLEAVPYVGADPARERRWRPAADGRLFDLRTNGERLPAGWVALELEIAGGVTAAPRLLVDDGRGFADAAALQLPPIKGGRVRSIVELPPRVRQLVLEVGNNASRISLGSLLASELGAAETAVRLMLPVILRRFAEPWTIPISAVRLVRALFTGGFLQRMVQKQRSYDEPQLWYEAWHRRFAELSEGDRADVRAAVAHLVNPPHVCVLLGTGSPEDTRRSIESVSRQLYPHWDLFVPGEPESEDPRIHAAPWNGTTGDLVVFLRAGDELTEHALFLLAGESDADLVYADEDSLDDQGRLYDPVFKPDWNPDLFLSTNYLGRAWAVRRARVTEAGGHARDPFEVLVRAVGSPWTIRHVPFVICHRSAADPPEAHAAAVRVLQRHLGDAAAVEPGPFPGTQRVRWKLPESPPLVSLIIPTRDGRELLEPCVESLIAQTAYRNFEILIVDNGSSDPDALDYLANLERRGTARVLRSDRPFNFSALNNLAVAEARGEVVGLLNNDLEFIEPEWLGEMVSHALRPEVGAVGARLLYPDRTVQHVGVILGIGGVADHVHKHLPADAPGYCGRARLTQDFSAVTAACLLVRRKTYLEVGGLDERFAVAFNDVDFCLRIRDRGLRNVWTPYATVVHHESKSRGLDRTPARVLRFRGEIALLKSRWGRSLLEDPAYNPNLTLDAKNVALAWPPRVSPPWRRG